MENDTGDEQEAPPDDQGGGSSDDGRWDWPDPYSRGDDRLDRACGEPSDAQRVDRATGGGDLVCRADGPPTPDFLGELVKAARADPNESRPPEQLPASAAFENRVAVTERASSWSGLDLADPLGGYAEMLKVACDFGGGIRDFFDNYQQMRDANVKGADRYFHCMANCEATERGPGGEAAALLIGFGREAVDLPKNVLIKGMSFKDSINDAQKDLEANRVGRDGALSGVRCGNVCGTLRPRGL